MKKCTIELGRTYLVDLSNQYFRLSLLLMNNLIKNKKCRNLRIPKRYLYYFVTMDNENPNNLSDNVL